MAQCQDQVSRGLLAQSALSSASVLRAMLPASPWMQQVAPHNALKLPEDALTAEVPQLLSPELVSWLTPLPGLAEGVEPVPPAPSAAEAEMLYRSSVRRKKSDCTASSSGAWLPPDAMDSFALPRLLSRKNSKEDPRTPVTPTLRSKTPCEFGSKTSDHCIGTPTNAKCGSSTRGFAGLMTMTPEMPSSKAQVWTPPPAPNMYHERNEVKNDMAIALSFNSVPLLSLALCRSHVCSGREHSSGKSSADHSLHEAISMKRLDAVALLLKNGPKELLAEPCGGIRPLSRALKCAVNQTDASFSSAKLLLEHGANPDLGSGPNLDTPLHQAAADGAINAVQLLLEFGANPNARNAEQHTPLHSLCRVSNYLPRGEKEQVVNALLGCGTDPTKTDKYGLRAVDYLRSFESGVWKLPLKGGPLELPLDRQSPVQTSEMTTRIRDNLLRAAVKRARLQLILVCGTSGDHGSIFCKLPVVILESVGRFL